MEEAFIIQGVPIKVPHEEIIVKLFLAHFVSNIHLHRSGTVLHQI